MAYLDKVHSMCQNQGMNKGVYIHVCKSIYSTAVIPTVQLGPTGDTVTVTPPPLHEQYNMQSLSVKYWAEDEREEMARSVEVEAGQVQIHLPGKQRRKKYKAKAVAMYAISPESAVSSPPLTIPKEGTTLFTK